MKYLRIGIPLACAVVALAAFGPATASATRLCSVSMNQCPAANRWLATTPIAADTAVSTTFLTSIGTVSCTKSPLTGKTASDGGGAGVNVSATIEKWEFTGCTLGKTACTATVEGLNYTWTIKWTVNFDGKVKLSPQITVVCGELINCTFTAPGVELELKGGEAAGMIANEYVLSRQGTTCPTTAKLKGTWEFSSPGPLYFTNE